MINLDCDALECDFAETYHIYDLRALPLRKAALYAAGLRDNSRIKMRMANMPVPFDELLMASVTDKLSIVISVLAGGDKPPFIVDKILDSEKEDGAILFDSGEDFLAYRNSLLNDNELEE